MRASTSFSEDEAKLLNTILTQLRSGQVSRVLARGPVYAKLCFKVASMVDRTGKQAPSPSASEPKPEPDWVKMPRLPEP